MKRFYGVVILAIMLLSVFSLTGQEAAKNEENQEEKKFLKLFTPTADARFRYQVESWERDWGEGTETRVRDRMRVRIRTGLAFDPIEKLRIYARLSTGNLTMGSDNFGDQGNGPNQETSAYFDDYWVEGKPFSFLTIRAGGYSAPFTNSTLIWHPNWRVTGINENFRFSFGDHLFYFNATQVFYEEGSWVEGKNPFKSDTHLFVQKMGLNLNFIDKLRISPSATFHIYTNNMNSENLGLSDEENKQHYRLFNPSLDITWSFSKRLPLKLYGDVVYNFGASEENIAYEVGAVLGRTREQFDFSLAFYYRHADLFSIDPNTSTDQLPTGLRVNADAFHAAAGIALFDFWVLQAEFYHGKPKNDSDQKYTNFHINSIFRY